MQLSELRSSIQDKGYATDTATAQTSAVNAAYRRVLGLHRWPFLEKQTSVSTVVGTSAPVISGISDLRGDGINAVRLRVSANDAFTMEYRDPQEFRDYQHEDTLTGEPQFWTMINGALQLWPTPGSVYTVTIDYTRTPPALTADADTPVFASEFHDVLVWGAITDIAYRERDYSGAAWANQRYTTLVGEMERSYGIRQKQSVRHVQRSGFWDAVGRR